MCVRHATTLLLTLAYKPASNSALAALLFLGSGIHCNAVTAVTIVAAVVIDFWVNCFY